jgi:thioredoxin 1
MTEITKGPSTLVKALIVVTLAVVVGVVFIAKGSLKIDARATLVGSPSEVIPKIVDLGASKCIPCKMMAPILEELKIEYMGQFDTDTSR